MLGVTFKLRLSAEEMGEWKRKAAEGGKSLALWIREKCNEGVVLSRGVESRPTGILTAPAQPVIAGARKIRQCPHGIGSGYRCWQCGGMAQVIKE